MEKVHLRVSSPLNYHDGYWVAKREIPGKPFKAKIINDMHVDPYTKRVTVYAQNRVLGKVVAPAQVGPGEFVVDNAGNKTAHHPNSVYLNGSGQELAESDGTGEWWVKHSWVLDGEGYNNWQLIPMEDYGEGLWVEAVLLEDGLTMKIGGSEGDQVGYNTRVPIFGEKKLEYSITRWSTKDNGEVTEDASITLYYEKTKSAFDNLARVPMGEE
jgi:hypothetical protein